MVINVVNICSKTISLSNGNNCNKSLHFEMIHDRWFNCHVVLEQILRTLTTISNHFLAPFWPGHFEPRRKSFGWVPWFGCERCCIPSCVICLIHHPRDTTNDHQCSSILTWCATGPGPGTWTKVSLSCLFQAVDKVDKGMKVWYSIIRHWKLHNLTPVLTQSWD